MVSSLSQIGMLIAHIPGIYLSGFLPQQNFFLLLSIPLSSFSWFLRWILWLRRISCTFGTIYYYYYYCCCCCCYRYYITNNFNSNAINYILPLLLLAIFHMSLNLFLLRHLNISSLLLFNGWQVNLYPMMLIFPPGKCYIY